MSGWLRADRGNDREREVRLTDERSQPRGIRQRLTNGHVCFRGSKMQKRHCPPGTDLRGRMAPTTVKRLVVVCPSPDRHWLLLAPVTLNSTFNDYESVKATRENWPSRNAGPMLTLSPVFP
jgi:hypothetical protein